MQVLDILKKYYKPDSLAYKILVTHCGMVARKSFEVAHRVQHLKPNTTFIREAAMLHDIGMFLTDSPEIDCHGKEPYIKHGILGRQILEKEGLPKHALVCERHIGVGLSLRDIVDQQLPLPHRDMLPVTLEEKIICYADCFYEKNPNRLREEKSLEKVSKSISKWGEENLARLRELQTLFNDSI